MRRIIFFLAINVFLFSGIIQGPLYSIMKGLDAENDGYLSTLKFDKVAWAKKPGPPPPGHTGPPPPGHTGPPPPGHILTPAPGAAILIVLGIAVVAVVLRKNLKK